MTGIGDLHRRALVVRIGALGDVVLTRRLTRTLSLAGFATTLMAPSRHARILARDPWIDGVLDSESPAFTESFGGSWPHGAGTFDLAVVVSRSAGLAEAARMAASSVLELSPDPERSDVPIAMQFAEGAAAVAEPFRGCLPDLPVDATQAAFHGRVVLHAGSGSAQKNWAADRFVALGAALQDAGHRVLWVRGPAEEAPPEGALAFDVLDRPTLPVLAATLAEAQAFVGNDSGVSHLAAAVGAPALALFGPTSESVWKPDGRRVRTLCAPEGRLDALPVADVLAAVRALPGFGGPDPKAP